MAYIYGLRNLMSVDSIRNLQFYLPPVSKIEKYSSIGYHLLSNPTGSVHYIVLARRQQK